MSNRDVFVVSAARTPIGAFQGALGTVPAPRLGEAAIRAALERGAVDPAGIDETYMGNVLSAGLGQAPARQAARFAGVDDHTPATTISKVCGSGLMSVILGTKSVLLGDADVALVGGMESMSGAPYLLPKARSGYRMGHGTTLDSMILDGLWDPFGDQHMGQCGELCASKFAFSRERQDEFTQESYRRALGADFGTELTSVTVKERRRETVVSTDEEPGRAKLDKMSTLRPAFGKEGTITAASASKISDGAAAMVLASGDAVKAHGLSPIAKIVAYAGFAQHPDWFTTAPAGAVKNVLERAGLTPADIGLWEVNEAFAVVTLACAHELELDLERVNVKGGAVALGHPLGASGARILVTLLHAMQERKVERGLATLCIGGGEAVAVVVEAVA